MSHYEKAFLHVGTDKTGSTSIQRALSALRKPLRRMKLAAYLPGHAHASLGSYFCAEPERCPFNRGFGEPDRARIQERDAQWLREAEELLQGTRGCPTWVASFEGFIGLPDDGLKGMVKWARRQADEVHAVVYVRNPFSYAVSAMSQNVRMGRDPCPEGQVPVHDFTREVGRLVKVFGRDRVIVRSFDAERLVGADVVSDFIHLIGAADVLRTPEFAVPELRNPRMSSTALALCLAVSKALADAGLQVPPAEFHRKFGNVIGELPGPSIKLTPAQADELARNSRKGLEYLRKEFGIEFTEPAERYTAAATDPVSALPVGDVAQVIARLMVKQSLVEEATGRIEVRDVVARARAGDRFVLGVDLYNDGSMSWRSTPEHPLHVAYRFRVPGRKRVGGGGRQKLQEDRVYPRSQCRVDLPVEVPSTPGVYDLEINVVQEGHAWFDRRGFTPFVARVEVH